MGLAVEVGLLSWQKNNGGIQDFVAQNFEELSKFLAAKGYPNFKEPEDCPIASFGMYGYVGLHYLRRIAAHLNLSNAEPDPGMIGGESPASDPVLAQYNALIDSAAPEPKRNFDHLINHSDAFGFYVPIDFAEVLTGSRSEVWGDFVGSSFRLLEESKILADFLQLPLDLDPEDKAFFDAVDSQGIGEQKWQRYGIESFTCIRLFRSAEHSIKTGSTIVFC